MTLYDLIILRRLLFLLFLVLSLYVHAAITVKIAIADYAPYTDQQVENKGVVAHLIRRSFEEQGYKVEFVFMPWHRIYHEGQMNNYDAIAYFSCSPERSELFYCSEPVYQDHTVFFYHKQRPLEKWQGLHDLSGIKIGATYGYSYTADFWHMAQTQTLNIEATVSAKQNLTRLLEGSVDTVALPLLVGKRVLQNQLSKAEINAINYHFMPLATNKYHVLFLKRQKRSRRLRVELNKGLSQLKKTGQYDVIISQYH